MLSAITIFYSLESRGVACDPLSPCPLNTRLCLQNTEMNTYPSRRGYVFPKMEGRKVSIAWPPPSPALVLAPGRVKNSPPTLQMHHVLSTPVPLDRIFSRPLTLFLFSTEKLQIQPRPRSYTMVLSCETLLPLHPSPSLPTDFISFPSSWAPRRKLG